MPFDCSRCAHDVGVHRMEIPAEAVTVSATDTAEQPSIASAHEPATSAAHATGKKPSIARSIRKRAAKATGMRHTFSRSLPPRSVVGEAASTPGETEKAAERVAEPAPFASSTQAPSFESVEHQRISQESMGASLQVAADKIAVIVASAVTGVAGVAHFAIGLLGRCSQAAGG